MSSVSSASSAPPATRDYTIDVIRIGSLAVVIAMHWLYTQTYVDDAGEVGSRLALHGPVVWTLTWLLQVMPLFFIAGGFANTMIVDRGRDRSYGQYLGLRARRLTTPLLPLMAVVVPLATVAAWISDDLGRQVGDHAANPLWFLAVYLLCVAVAPLQVRAHDRSPWLAPVVLMSTALGVDAVRFVSDVDTVGQLNLAFVWVFCHQLGVVHARGSLRNVPSSVLFGGMAAGVAVLVVMVAVGPWFPTVLGLRDAPVSNLAPPTAVLCVLGIIQLCVLTVVTRRIPEWQPSPPARRRIETLNALLMVLFLWHVPVLIALTGVGLLVPPLLPFDEGAWWALRPLWLGACCLVLWGVGLLAGRFELWANGFAARTSTVATCVGAVLATAGIFAIWQDGLWFRGASVFGIPAVLVAVVLLSTFQRHRRA